MFDLVDWKCMIRKAGAAHARPGRGARRPEADGAHTFRIRCDADGA